MQEIYSPMMNTKPRLDKAAANCYDLIG